MPKVSIIIPIYNVENYVRKGIESAINQTESDIEIILVDDGSTDNSGIICDDYAKKDSRIKVIHKENGGLSSARNAGAQIATADYVQFLDGDDYLREDSIEILIKAIKQYPSDFIQFQYKEVDDNGQVLSKSFYDTTFQVNNSRNLFAELYKLGGVAASGATKLFKRELILDIPFENIRHEDEMWCTRAFQRDLIVTYIPDELYYYVMRSGSIMHSKFSHKKLDSFVISDERIKVLSSLGYTDLLTSEYNRLFHIILELNNEANMAKDKVALNTIKEKFLKYKKEIKKYSSLSSKFQFILNLMLINYSFINIYLVYWRIKVNK